MATFKLKNALLNENFEFGGDAKYNTLDKQAFLDRCKQFSAHGSSIYRAKDLKERISEIKDLIETAEKLTLQETENWFDGPTVQRHIKQMKESYKVFEKTGGELISLQQRLESSYEDIAEILGKYYDIS